MNDEYYLKNAISKARESVAQGGFPAGAIIVKNGEVVGEGISIGHILTDPTSHRDVFYV
jgi:tRNA(Arg) A34 adenosine deaminase TadA